MIAIVNATWKHAYETMENAKTKRTALWAALPAQLEMARATSSVTFWNARSMGEIVRGEMNTMNKRLVKSVQNPPVKVWKLRYKDQSKNK